jgi:hypothetical protein
MAQAKGGAVLWSLKGKPHMLIVDGKDSIKVQKEEVKNETVKEVVEEVVEVIDTNIYDGNFTFKVKKIDTEGVAHIIFSEPMIDTKGGFNLTWLNDTTLKLTIVPTEGSLFEMEKYRTVKDDEKSSRLLSELTTNETIPSSNDPDIDFHYFTWEPKSFRGDTL